MFEDRLGRAILGAAMEVHNELGDGFLEIAYHRALAYEFDVRRIPYEHEAQLPRLYKGVDLGVPFRADFVCAGAIVVELKALPDMGPRERRQLRHYLNATGQRRGLLLNFGRPLPQFERVDLDLPTVARPQPGTDVGHS